MLVGLVDHGWHTALKRKLVARRSRELENAESIALVTFLTGGEDGTESGACRFSPR